MSSLSYCLLQLLFAATAAVIKLISSMHVQKYNLMIFQLYTNNPLYYVSC